MKRLIALGFLAAMIASPSFAALKVGVRAPDFTTKASLGGKAFDYSLAAALQQGPVVLYFYPAAFTKGCTIEAHDFAAAMDKYHALGASVIGVSHDGIKKLNKFSVSECRSKFPVASDADQRIMKSYDAVLPIKPQLANRTSYVIAPGGEILYSYTDLNPAKHVENTLTALRDWVAQHNEN